MLEEEEAKDEGRDNPKGEDQMMVQENAAEVEGGKSPSVVERLEFDDRGNELLIKIMFFFKEF